MNLKFITNEALVREVVEPGPNFIRSFENFPPLIERMERQLCPRVHFKHIIIEGRLAYTGSANLTW